MSTRTQLIQRVKQLLRDPAAVDSGTSFAFTDAEIISAIEESRREIHGQLAVRFPEKVSSVTTMTYTADSERVVLPTSAPDLSKATISQVRARDSSSSSSYDYRLLKAVNLDELMRVSMYGGQPGMYAIQGGYIWLRPYSSAQTLSITYVPELTDLGASDSPTEISGRYHHVYAWDAAVSLQEQSGDTSPLAPRRDIILGNLMEFMHNLAPDAGLEGG